MRYHYWLLLATLPVAADTLYQWQDETGTVHYADRPAPPDPAALPTRSASLVPSPGPVPARPPAPLFGYRLRLPPPSSSPGMPGLLVFSAELEPRPASFRLQLWLDGQPVAQAENNTQMTLNRPPPGDYHAVVKLLGKDGKLLAESKAITFSLHRTQAEQAVHSAP